MEYLMRHPRQVLSRANRTSTLGVGNRTRKQRCYNARRLRQRLQAVGAKDWLETVYGMGYRLNPPNES